MEKVKEFKEKVIEKLKTNYKNADELIELIDDNDIQFSIINGFSIDSYVYSLTF